MLGWAEYGDSEVLVLASHTNLAVGTLLTNMKKLSFLVLICVVTVATCGKHAVNRSGESHDTSAHGSHGVHLASWRWDEFSSPILFTGMLIIAVILKILFHHMPFLEKLLPESCVLILVGVVCGLFIDKVLLMHSEDKRFSEFPKFTANLFFNILLPPIIFDSALSLYLSLIHI